MNLYRFIIDNELDELKVMNFLQCEGLISDLCVTSGNVAQVDCPRAIEAVGQEFFGLLS